MRRMKGQWEQEIDWQRTWLGTRQRKTTESKPGSQKLQGNMNGDKRRQPEPIEFHCVEMNRTRLRSEALPPQRGPQGVSRIK